MAATPSLRVVKSFVYRDQTRLWSNRYHFNGGTPADGTHWHTFMDAVTAAEKLILPSPVQIVEALGYAAGSEVPVATKTYALTGTASVSGGTIQAGDVAGLIRYATAARTSKNHPVYLFNYYHGVYNQTAELDKLNGSLVTLYNTYAGAWISGFSDGSLTLVRAGPNGATATGSVTEVYLTHRDFPR